MGRMNPDIEAELRKAGVKCKIRRFPVAHYPFLDPAKVKNGEDEVACYMLECLASFLSH